ncbi:cyclic AMP-dependent transcription factor ATF-3-like [Acanthaster planci]|uniref:Cyclic AMP-dependent transcription factor ATF-3-like n=1 Tax=Acanthaster planci TaxID=133434 RepID=A0A8B7ZMX5_ACAPL|nr:cyclic AMP-dependent transcription factor ATF-3-like [Acanthaster planci]
MDTEANLEPLIMPIVDGAWDQPNYEMAATSLATEVAAAAVTTTASESAISADGFDQSTSPPHMNRMETEGNLLQHTMLREELRVNIMHRRLQKGLGAVQLEWRFAKSDKLTPEEEQKRRLRRERNRVAASRCRERRREKTFVLVTETDKLETSNQELMAEIQQLETERQELMSILAAHQQTCGCSPPVLTPSIEDLHIDP